MTSTVNYIRQRLSLLQPLADEINGYIQAPNLFNQ